MKTIFDPLTRESVIKRINSLSLDHKAQWGKMTVYQMIRHGCLSDEMLLGKQKYKRMFIGRIIGRISLNNVTKNDDPLKQGTPSIPPLLTKDNGEIEKEKAKWVSLVNEYANYSPNVFEHFFFGRMTMEQLGQFVFKHIDHHLRQFNA